MEQLIEVARTDARALLEEATAGVAARDLTDESVWLQSRRSGEWVHMFMQGAWVNAQL